MEKKHVFISYRRDGALNQQWAERIDARLNEQGFKVWRDVEGIQPGERWTDKIPPAIEQSALVLCIISESILQSEWVDDELNFARSRKLIIVPVRIEEAYRPPFMLSGVQPFNLYTDDKIVWKKLFELVGRHVPCINDELQTVRSPYNVSNGHIFISYAREDRGRVAILAQLFEEEGWSVWWDRDNMSAGQSLDEVIGSAIDDSSCVLVCWSLASIGSRWVKDEATEGLEQRKLVPVLFDDVKPPLGFRNIHNINFHEWNNLATHEAYQRLKTELSQKQPQRSADNLDQKSRAAINEPFNSQTEELDILLARFNDSALEPEQRLEIGDRLAELGDPRTGVGLNEQGLPDIDWVRIPGGEFLYGENKEPHRLETFHIARYPITNTQFQAFINDGGYDDDDLWAGLPEWKRKPGKSAWRQPNRPCTFVNWYEAIAYCRWLGERLGYCVQLPTNYQWERAVRGVDGRKYPWGDETGNGLANVDEISDSSGFNNLQQPSTVGLYYRGASPEGVLDLSGNIGEWGQYENKVPGNVKTLDKIRCVVRGGSWRGSLANAHASIRLVFFPYKRFGTIGFRVVRRNS